MTDATELDIDAIRARCDAATEGPWFGSGGGRHVYGATPGDEVAECRRRADADFVRHARTDLPAALDENERLRAALDEARRERDEMAAEVNDLTADWDQEHARALAAESALAAVRALLPDECWEVTCIACQIRAVLPAPTSPERSEP